MKNIMSFFRLYTYNASRYKNTFLENDCHSPSVSQIENKVVYCFWTGDNVMSKNREACLESMKRAVGVPLVLITPKNIADFILPDFPLHKSFEHLSLVHKSDYLRCYMMHHYGGGYSDIKKHENSFEKSFDKLHGSDSWVMGYREIGERGVAKIEGILGDDLRRHWSKLIGNCSYICKPYTPFTYEWYDELHRRMDRYSEQLALNPGNVMGDNKGYPIPWTNILGDIFHPLCLKYHHKIMLSKTIKPIFSDYR